MIKIGEMDERAPGLFPHPEPKPGKIVHVLKGEVLPDQPGSVNPEGRAAVAAERFFQGVSPL
jgi:hypothetical protein